MKVTLSTKYHNYRWGITIFDKKGNSVVQKMKFSECRSWICDALFQMKNPEYKQALRYPFTFNYKTGTSLFGVSFISVNQRETFYSNLDMLHSKEKQAKTRCAKIHKTKNPLVVIVEASKCWKDSCWKMMLYTFYLKSICYKEKVDAYFWEALEGNEDTLLSKVRMKQEKEIFDTVKVYKNNSYGRHEYEGFYSICRGSNRPMAKLLGIQNENT